MKLPLIREVPVIIVVAFIILLASLFFEAAYAYPVPELPGDNLIVNPWFRNFSNPKEAGFDGWTRPLNEGVTWGPSQKESNPSPDIVITGTCGFQEVYCGTAARWAEQFGVLYPYIDVYTYQVVAADPSHRKLKFFTHYVSHIAELGAVNIYAGQTAEGPWELLWVPLYHSETKLIIPESGDVRDLWLDTGFLEWTFEQGYPYYKIELQSRLPESPIPNGIRGVGFKVTGVYFSTEYTDEPGQPPPPPNLSGSIADDPPVEPGDSTAVPTAVALAATPEAAATSVGSPAPTATTESGDIEAATLTAEAVSVTEIIIAWSETQNNGRGLRLERSLNVASGWQSIAVIEPGIVQYTDSGLPPDTVHYYRLRASEQEVSPVVSVRTLAAAEPTLAAPTTLRLQSTQPSQVLLKWNDLSENEEGFEIERSQDGVTFAPLQTLGPDITEYTDTPAEAGTYYYRVRSFRGDTVSAYSEVAQVEMNGRRAEEGTAVAAAGGDSVPTRAPETAAQQPAVQTPGGQSSLLLTGLVVLAALVVGVGLGLVLSKRRA